MRLNGLSQTKKNIGRRTFLIGSALGSASLFLNSGCTAGSGLRTSSNSTLDATGTHNVYLPNVLLIMTDQHRFDLMTCAGNDLVPTPGIDRIAARGVRFTHAYCPYPVCVASRMAMLSGQYAHTTGAITNEDTLDWRYRTVAHHFAANGYLTALIGKMHFNDAHNHGFEYYMSINDWLMYLGPKVQHYANEIASHPHNTYFTRTVFDTGAGFPDMENLWSGPSPWSGNVNRSDFKAMASKLKAEDHLDMFIARETAKFLHHYRDQRFFLLASFMKPHTPFFPPREFADKYPIEKMELRPINDPTTYPRHIQNRIRSIQRINPWQLKAGRAGYLGNLAFVDTCIDYVYRALETEGLLDNTIVVYTSDHGEMDGTHGLYQKFCLFDPAVRVPLIVSYPRQLPQNKVSSALIEYMSLYPTLSDLCGLPKPSPVPLMDIPHTPNRLDAISFANLVRNPGSKVPDAAFSEYAIRSGMPRYMIRTDRYKLIYNESAANELYDHQIDHQENVNRIEDSNYIGIRKDLLDRLFAWYNPETNPWRKRI